MTPRTPMPLISAGVRGLGGLARFVRRLREVEPERLEAHLRRGEQVERPGTPGCARSWPATPPAGAAGSAAHSCGARAAEASANGRQQARHLHALAQHARLAGEALARPRRARARACRARGPRAATASAAPASTRTRQVPQRPRAGADVRVRHVVQAAELEDRQAVAPAAPAGRRRRRPTAASRDRAGCARRGCANAASTVTA